MSRISSSSQTLAQPRDCAEVHLRQKTYKTLGRPANSTPTAVVQYFVVHHRVCGAKRGETEKVSRMYFILVANNSPASRTTLETVYPVRNKLPLENNAETGQVVHHEYLSHHQVKSRDVRRLTTSKVEPKHFQGIPFHPDEGRHQRPPRDDILSPGQSTRLVHSSCDSETLQSEPQEQPHQSSSCGTLNIMSNHIHDDYPDEPPPSYEEAIGAAPSTTISPLPSPIPPRLPPRLPPRNRISIANLAASVTSPSPSAPTSPVRISHGRAASYNSNNPFFNKPSTYTNTNTNANGNTLTIPPQQQQHHRRHTSASASSTSYPASPIFPLTPGLHHPAPFPSGSGPAQSFSQLPFVAQQLQPRQFPPSINLYRDAFPGALQRRYFLGEHQATPLYAVAAWLSSPYHHHHNTSPSLSSSLVLHNGPSEDYPPLATASYDNVWGGRRTMHVVLPPLPGQERSEPIVVQTGTTSPLLLGGGGGMGGGASNALAFSFSVEVPWPTTLPHEPNHPDASTLSWRKEPYEWRRSNSYAVGGLGGSSQGWKLVRLANELPPGGLAVAGSGPPSGDGHEVVAVCTNAVMSMTKLWKFSFLGTGLSGVLGERWAVMAVMTGLVIWDRDSRRDGLR